VTHSALRGRYLAELTWQEAESAIPEADALVLPIGAGAKEHGPHLLLENDYRLAGCLAARLAERCDVLILPTVPYGYYPAFLEYPGSVSLGFETFRDTVVEICQSLAPHGAAWFYVLNTGISTARPLREAAERLGRLGVRMRFTDFAAALESGCQQVETQSIGSHADEIETSLMMYLAPETVRIDRALRDGYDDRGGGGLSRDPRGGGIFSPSGIFGDATLATSEKGAILTRELVDYLARDVRRGPDGT